MGAATIDAALDALAQFSAPAQNVALADARDVAIAVAGRAPLRDPEHATKGVAPGYGHEARNDWRGFLPFSEMPRSVRPASGVVANANNRTTDDAFPRHISHRWETPYRIRRLRDLLGDHQFHTGESFRRIQNDIVSQMALDLLPLIADELWSRSYPDPSADPMRGEALDGMRRWDGSMHTQRWEPLVFMAWTTALTEDLLKNLMAGTRRGIRPAAAAVPRARIRGRRRRIGMVRRPIDVSG